MQNEPIQLKGGFTTLDPRLDRLPYFDEQSLKYLNVRGRGVSRPALRSNTHNRRKFKIWLDQKRQGSCVSFGIGHDVLAFPQERFIEDSVCRVLYHEMQRRDPWPGGSYPGATPVYEGTAVLTGLAVYKEWLEAQNPKQKWEYRWNLGGDDTITALTSRGCIIGVDWFEGMFETDENGFIWPTGRVGGGHCVFLDQSQLVWRKNVTHYEPKDLERELTTIRGPNTWGQDWGVGGNFRMTLASLDFLLSRDGESAVLVPVKA